MEFDGKYVINIYLKSLLESAGHKQVSIAAQAKLDVRTVRRALNGERVEISTVKALAKALDCSPEDLMGRSPNVWVLSRGGEFSDLRFLSFKSYLFEVTELIQEDVDRYNHELESEGLAIEVKEARSEITISARPRNSSKDMVWTFRPAVFTETGLVYAKISGWDEFTWNDDKYDFFRRLGDDVKVNGGDLISKRVKPSWHVEFSKLSKFGERKFLGQQSFPDGPSFRDSLFHYLRTVKVIKVEKTHYSEVRLETMNGEGLHQVILIYRASFGPGGAVFKASLHNALANRIVASLSKFNPGIDFIPGFSDYQVPFGPCAKSTAIH